MQRGAVAMIDALGFKGIWRRHSAGAVLEKMRALKTELLSWKERVHAAQTAGRNGTIKRLRVEMISDTIAFGVVPEENERFRNNPSVRDALAVLQAAALCSLAMRRALDGPVPLLYRGCVALGDFEIEDGFLLGNAVDEAADGMDRAQGAFVWFAPSARPLADAMMNDSDESRIRPVQPWEVPLHGGHVYATHAVLPFNGEDPADVRDAIARRVAESFGSDLPLDVDIKKVNTLQFIAAALAHYIEGTSRNPT